MFWTFLLAISLATAFVKLGAASAMVGMLSMALQCAVLAIAILTAVLLLRRGEKNKRKKSSFTVAKR